MRIEEAGIDGAAHDLYDGMLHMDKDVYYCEGRIYAVKSKHFSAVVLVEASNPLEAQEKAMRCNYIPGEKTDSAEDCIKALKCCEKSSCCGCPYYCTENCKKLRDKLTKYDLLIHRLIFKE